MINNSNINQKSITKKLNVFTTIGVLCFTIIVTVTLLGFYNNSIDKKQYKDNFVRKKGVAIPVIDTFKLPETLTFANEPVPIARFDIRQKIQKEIAINTIANSLKLSILKRQNEWFPKYKEILDKHCIPYDFIYIAVAESGLENVVSPVNAKGHWQMMQGTAKELGLVVNEEIDERFHPLKSAEAACKYFKNAYDRLGSWTLAAVAYNRGVGGLKKAIKEQNENDYYNLELNKETARYMYKILAFKLLFQNHNTHPYQEITNNTHKTELTTYITITTDVHDIVEYANNLGITYNTLKTLNPWIISNSTITLGNGENQRQKYHIEIPKTKA